MLFNHIILFVFGTVFGSFVNVLIYRIPREKKFISGRSSCPICFKIIPWYGLVPVFSFVFQKGKCIYCKGNISWQYPLIEIISGLIFAGTALYIFNPLVLSNWISWLFYVVLLEVIIILSVIDLKHFILPDSLIIFLIVTFAIYYLLVGTFGITSDFIQSDISLKSRLLGVLFIGGALFLLWLLSKGRALGFGDVKLMSVLGIILGLKGGIIIFYIAMFLGLLVGLFLIFFKKAGLKTKIPFGTFIGISVIIYLFLYQQIISYVDFLILRVITVV